ncbi:MAG: flagellar motor protein MotD [Gammaproteobacteria bacterium]|nr:flagellar motor protein MotD [Gammaproteobacteria bacterium]
MARKKKHEEHVNLERWLVSYADFITLLFAFFVVMYAISSVNEGKYRVMADSIKSALTSADPRTMSPLKVGDPGLDVDKPRLNDSPKIGKSQTVIEQPNKDDPSRGDVIEQVNSSMKALIDKGLISVREDKNWIEIEISNSVLFVSGSAKLAPEAVPLLKIMSRILRRFPNTIQVEGFTDNQQISNEYFPSNWELSAARSASVVRLFERSGVDSERLTVVGYGSTRPSVENDSQRGRNKNRRVVLVINKQVERRATDQETRKQQSENPPEQQQTNAVPLVTSGGEEVLLTPAPVTNPGLDNSAPRIFRERAGE